MSDITADIMTLTAGPIWRKRKAMRALAERAFDLESRAAVPALRRELDGADPRPLGSPHQQTLLRTGPVLDLKCDEVSGGFLLTDVAGYAPPSVSQLAEMVTRSDEARMIVADAACIGDLYQRLSACRGLATAGMPLSSEPIRHLGAVLGWAAVQHRPPGSDAMAS